MLGNLVESSFTALAPPSKSDFQTHYKTFRILKKGYGEYCANYWGKF
jgi:hypothetical protein